VTATTVAIVVDPDYGERLEELALRMPVWVAQTQGNSAAIERLFRRFGREGGASLTSFVVDPEASREHWCTSVLETVDEHHGPFSQDPPYHAIEVIGTLPSPALRALCEELGFHSFRDTAGGFTATRPPSRKPCGHGGTAPFPDATYRGSCTAVRSGRGSPAWKRVVELPRGTSRCLPVPFQPG
jgi:hypothetical protein